MSMNEKVFLIFCSGSGPGLEEKISPLISPSKMCRERGLSSEECGDSQWPGTQDIGLLGARKCSLLLLTPAVGIPGSLCDWVREAFPVVQWRKPRSMAQCSEQALPSQTSGGHGG